MIDSLCGLLVVGEVYVIMFLVSSSSVVEMVYRFIGVISVVV